MQSGDRCQIVAGEYAGERGEIVLSTDDDDETASVVTDAGTFVEVPITALVQIDVSIDDIVRKVRGRAQARRGQLELQWWRTRASEHPTDLAAVYRESEAWMVPVVARWESAMAAFEMRYRAELATLDQPQLAARYRNYREEPIPTDVTLLGTDVPDQVEPSEDDPGRDLNRRAYAQVERETMLNASVEPISEARNATLEAAIDRDPSDANLLVYADWLQQQGNPRGELIAMDLAGRTPATFDREPFLAPMSSQWFALAWRGGYLDMLSIATTRNDEELGVDVMRRAQMAAGSAATRFLRELELGLPSIHEEAKPLAVLETIGARPTLRVLRLTTNLEEEMLSWTDAPDLGEPLAALFPNLEELHVHAGSYDLGAIDYPRMKKLTLRTCHAPEIAPIIEADWPELRELELWFGSSSYGVETPIAQLAALLHRPFPKLRSLSLSNGEHTDELIGIVLASPLLGQLESIALTNSTMTDDGAQLILANVGKLAHVTEIDLDENFISDDVIERLQDALNVHSESQREAEEYEGELHRYANIGE